MSDDFSDDVHMVTGSIRKPEQFESSRFACLLNKLVPCAGFALNMIAIIQFDYGNDRK